MWKILLFLLGKRKRDYVRVVKFGSDIFVIEIKEFISTNEEISKWKNALGSSRAPD